MLPFHSQGGRRAFLGALALAATVPVADLYAASDVPIAVVFSNLPGDSTSQVPGLPGATFNTFTPFGRLYGAANGHWALMAQSDQPSDQRDLLIVNGQLALREGTPAPFVEALPGELLGDWTEKLSLNSSGEVLFSNRLGGSSPPGRRNVLLRWDGTETSLVAREGSSTGLPGQPGSSWGSSLVPTGLDDAGAAAWRAFPVMDTTTGGSYFLVYQNDALLQSFADIPPGQLGSEPIFNISFHYTFLSGDGQRYLAQAGLVPAGSRAVVLVDGSVVLEEGGTLAGLPSTIGQIDTSFLDSAGNWFAAGRQVDGQAWLVRNGELVAETGEPIFPGASESWELQGGATFQHHVGNSRGDWVMGGFTDHPNQASDYVILLNGCAVAARTGEAVDLDGDGSSDDDVFLGSFSPQSIVLGDDLQIYAECNLVDGQDGLLGAAIVRIDARSALAQNFCSSTPNSSGGAALMAWQGSVGIFANDLTLSAAPVPALTPGLFYYGAAAAEVPFGNGLRCVGAGGVGLFRLPPTFAGSDGELSWALDNTSPPGSEGALTPGSTWFFQAWFRDPQAGGAAFDLSDGLEITFCP